MRSHTNYAQRLRSGDLARPRASLRHYAPHLGSATPIVLVTGPPASGKSFVAALVAERFGLPLIAKDAIKETLFESLGTGDVAWSQRPDARRSR